WELRTPEAVNRVQALRKYDLLSGFFIILGLLNLLTIPELSKWFLLSTTLLYGAVYQIYGANIRTLWKESSALIRFVVCILIALVFAAHAQQFGAFQFGKIKRQVGGGRPETAYLRFASNHADIPLSLNIPAITNNSYLSGFVGPVSVLFKSEKEIVFVNEAE